MKEHFALKEALAAAPQHWEQRRFRFVVQERNEKNVNSNMPLLSLSAAAGIQERDGDGGLGRQAPSDETVAMYGVVHPGDLVINPMWALEGGLASSDLHGAVSPAYRIYRPVSGVDSRYLHHLVRSSPYMGQYKLFIRGITTFDRSITKDDFHDLPILLPPLDEQRRIADFLDAETAQIDGLVALRNRQVKLLENRYRTAISEFVAPGISSAGERDKYWPWLPAQTSTARLGYAARVQTGITVDSKRERTDEDGEYPYLRVANVQGEEIDLSEIKTITVSRSVAIRSTLIPGDLVMTEANGNPDNLGRGAVWRGEIPGMVHQNHIFAIHLDRTKLMPEYLSALLASDHGRRYFRTTSTQVGIATTSSSKVLDFPVPRLPINEQQRVVKQCEEARSTNSRAVDVLARQLALLAERRQALVTAAVTGGITV